VSEEGNNKNGWNEWSKYVIKELERLNLEVKLANKKLDAISTDLAVLKLKAALIGGTVALIPTLIGLAIQGWPK